MSMDRWKRWGGVLALLGVALVAGLLLTAEAEESTRAVPLAGPAHSAIVASPAYSSTTDLDLKRAESYRLVQGHNSYNQGNYERAVAEYTQAITLNPRSIAAYGRRGDAYLALDDYERAIADYTHVIELDPGLIAAYKLRGGSYARWGKYEQAIADYDHFIELAPPEALDSL